ncbi:hypothetical protein [Parasitella parasitica]|uniref:Uncharacterized protein n=1 Tax=Parasitella parasitica TaxID=35722 RepID=A0A0B7MVZ3_9FUNG|nr:hypothetical protein [Parasitella parasitica]
MVLATKKETKLYYLEKPFRCGADYWFQAPECAELAACTFSKPLFVYYTGESVTCLPTLPLAPKLKPAVAPLLINSVKTSGGSMSNHWVTLRAKKSIKIKWPVIDPKRFEILSRLKRPSVLCFGTLNLSSHKPEIDSDVGK